MKPMIAIKVNGELQQTEAHLLSELVQKFSFNAPFYAVAINRTIIPRSEFETTPLKEGDEIEIVHAVGGG